MCWNIILPRMSKTVLNKDYKYLETRVFQTLGKINQYTCPFYVPVKMMRTLSMVHNCGKTFEKKIIKCFIKGNILQLQKLMGPQRPYDIRYIMLGLDICIILGNLNMYIWLCSRFNLIEKLTWNYFQEQMHYSNITSAGNHGKAERISKWLNSAR